MFEQLNLLPNLEQYHSVIILLVQLIVAALTYYYNFKYKSTLEKEVEKYKHKLHLEFVKVEVRTKQLFSIYPSLLLILKKQKEKYFYTKVLSNKIRCHALKIVYLCQKVLNQLLNIQNLHVNV